MLCNILLHSNTVTILTVDLCPICQIYTQKFRLCLRQDLVENMVVPLSFELEGHSRLFQKICLRNQLLLWYTDKLTGDTFKFVTQTMLLTSFYISRCQLSSVIKMNADKFTLKGREPFILVQLIHFNLEITICNPTDTHKSGGVVIPDGLGIPKGLQSRVSLNDLILQGTLIL